MRTRLPLGSIALLLCGASVSAHDDPGPWYLGAGLGLNTIDESEGIEPDDGYTLNAVIGYRLGGGGDGRFTLALEGEVYYANNDLDDFPIAFGTTSDRLETSAVFGNLVADWYWTDTTSLYVGAGAGYANSEVFQADDDSSAFQGKAGLRFYLSESFSWNVGYRYVQTDDVDGAANFQNEQHSVETGFRWSL